MNKASPSATPDVRDDPVRVLIVRLSALGDVLFALPAVDALRRLRPDWQIHWVVEDKAASLLDLYPGVARRIVYPRRALREGGRLQRSRILMQHLRALRRDRYDLVLDFQGNLKSGVHARLARGGRRLGLAKELAREGNHWFTSEHVSPPDGRVHRVDQAHAIVRAAVPDLPEEPSPARVELPAPALRFGHDCLTKLSLQSGNFVALHPGTSAFGAFKRWRPERFAQLADQLALEHGLCSLITWGPGERELAEKVAAQSDHARVAPPTGSLAELAAVLSHACLMVGSDSAPLHLASLLDTPVVALFGPKDARKYGPRFGDCRNVSTFVPCRPCSRRSCPDVLCMEEIRTHQVAAAAAELLPPTRRPPTRRTEIA